MGEESTNYSIAATVKVSIILRGWGVALSSVELRSIPHPLVREPKVRVP